MSSSQLWFLFKRNVFHDKGLFLPGKSPELQVCVNQIFHNIRFCGENNCARVPSNAIN